MSGAGWGDVITLVVTRGTRALCARGSKAVEDHWSGSGHCQVSLRGLDSRVLDRCLALDSRTAVMYRYSITLSERVECGAGGNTAMLRFVEYPRLVP